MLCQLLETTGIGIEYSADRILAGSAVTGQLLRECSNVKGFQYNVVNLYGDLMDCTELPSCATVAYMYDQAFPETLMRHLLACISRAPATLRLVISSKWHSHSEYKAIFEENGLFPLSGPIPCKMIVSGYSSTFHIFGRRCCHYADLGLPPTVSEKCLQYQHVTLPLLTKKEVLFGDVKSATAFWDDLYSQMLLSLSTKRLRCTRHIQEKGQRVGKQQLRSIQKKAQHRKQQKYSKAPKH